MNRLRQFPRMWQQPQGGGEMRETEEGNEEEREGKETTMRGMEAGMGDGGGAQWPGPSGNLPGARTMYTKIAECIENRRMIGDNQETGAPVKTSAQPIANSIERIMQELPLPPRQINRPQNKT